MPPQELNPGGAVIRIQVIEGYVDKVEWPAALSNYRDFFCLLRAKIIADRPTNIRTIERYLLLASDLPGLKFKNSLKPSATGTGAATLVVEVSREADRRARARSTIAAPRARGPLEYLHQRHRQQPAAHARGVHGRLCGHVPDRASCNMSAAAIARCSTAEGLTAFVNASYSWGEPGPAGRSGARLQDPQLAGRSRLELSVHPPARAQSAAHRRCGFCERRPERFFDDPGCRRVRATGCAACASRWTPTSPTTFKASTSSTSCSATASRASAAPRTAICWRRGQRPGRFHQARGDGDPRCSSCSPTSRCWWPATANMASRRCCRSELCGYGGRFFGRAYDPSEMVADSCLMVLGGTAGRYAHRRPRTSRRPSFMPSPTSATSTTIMLPRVSLDTWQAWMPPRLEGEFASAGSRLFDR